LSQNNSTCVRSLMPGLLLRLRIRLRGVNAVSWPQTERVRAPSSLSSCRALVRCRRWAEHYDRRPPHGARPRWGALSDELTRDDAADVQREIGDVRHSRSSYGDAKPEMRAVWLPLRVLRARR